MRTKLFASIVAVSLASVASAAAQAPKPATGSTGQTGSTGAARPQTPPTGTTQPAKPAQPPAAAAPPAPTAPPPAPTPNPAAGSAAQPLAPQPLPPPSSDAYSYTPDGRRDPFRDLINTGPVTDDKGKRTLVGPASMTVGEIQVRGVMQSRAGLLAMIMGPDNKTYIVHQGDKLLDGTIKQITPQGLVILQEVNDPLSLVKQREVRKLLRSLEDAK